MDHIRACHVLPQSKNETFVCLWKGCKVYDKSSCSKSWLDRHILCHSGDKPFKCIVAGCGARFTSQYILERHVNSHFSAQEQQTPNQKSLKGREDTPTKLLRRKRLKQKRKATKGKSKNYLSLGFEFVSQHMRFWYISHISESLLKIPLLTYPSNYTPGILFSACPSFCLSTKNLAMLTE